MKFVDSRSIIGTGAAGELGRSATRGEVSVGRFELLQPVAYAAFDRYAVTSFNQLAVVDQTVILIWSLQGEVDNGGFDQFYFNSSGDFAIETVAALERIGAKQTARLVAEGNRLFPTQRPPSQREARIAELDTFSEAATETWDRLEMGFYSDPDGLEERLVEYLVHEQVLPESVLDQAERVAAADGGGR